MKSEQHILKTKGRSWSARIIEKRHRIEFDFSILFSGEWPKDSASQFIDWIFEITKPYRGGERPLTCNLPDRIVRELGLNYAQIHGVDWVFKMEKKGKLCTE